MTIRDCDFLAHLDESPPVSATSTTPCVGKHLDHVRGMSPASTTRLVEPKSRATLRTPSSQVEKIRRILVCLDRSALAEACLPYAVALAQTFGSKLTLVNVMEPPRDGRGRATTDALGWEIARQEATSY